MTPIIRHTSYISQLKVPLPFSLRYVNSYLIEGSLGYTVIDPGLHTAEAEALWLAVLRELSPSRKHIERIVLTHHHPDHYGMAGWLQELTQAPVLLSAKAQWQAQLLWGAEQLMTAQLLELYARHGLPCDEHAPMTKHLSSFVPQVSPHPDVTVWTEPTLRIGDRTYEVIETAGHAAGHLSFYDADAQHIFCGDHVLPQISPNVSFLPEVEADPLGAYMESLQQMSKLHVSMAFPGHGEPWPQFTNRARELITHHQNRLGHIVEQLTQPTSAYQVSLALFGQTLNIHQFRFAFSETIAHLIHLHHQQTITQVEGVEGSLRYVRNDAATIHMNTSR